jgi:predicted MFS family arabinose efflux permease
LGLGLGESGRVSMFSKENTGGENQFIITGVQVGIPMLLLYMGIHLSLMVTAFKNLKSKVGKIKRLSLTLFLFKIGILIPMFTSNTESFIYISYITWFLAGLMMNLISEQDAAQLNYQNHK